MGCYINFSDNILEYDCYINPEGCIKNEDAKTEWLKKVGKKVSSTYITHRLFPWEDTDKRPVVRVRNFGFSALGVLFNKRESQLALGPILKGEDTRKYEIYMVDTDEIRKICPDFVNKYERFMEIL